MSLSDSVRAAFVASVTADMTHELRNVLAIIRETAGLVDDIVSCSDGAPDQDKIGNLLGRIEQQTDRGGDLATVLNQLAHAGDSASGLTNLNRAASHVALMCNRRARRQRQSIIVEPYDDEIRIAGDRLGIYMAIHGVVTGCLDQLPDSVQLRIAVTSAGAGSLQFAASGEGSGMPLDSEKINALDRLIAAMAESGASLIGGGQDGPLRLSFSGAAE